MTLVIAHRGASAEKPENTVAAFARAVELGADAVELDVRHSSDSVLVVSHDATYGDGRAVCDVAFADRPDGVCGLIDAIGACADLIVNVEIKNMPGDAGFEPDHAIADAVVEVLSAIGPADRFVVSSFNLDTIDRVRGLPGAPPTALLTYSSALDPATVFGLAIDRGHRFVHPENGQVDEAYVVAAHDAGLAVNVWTVDDPSRIAALGSFGVDGVVTNVPDVARTALGDGAPG
ncbi:MAG TPA: glycerophosphodiester phosphodiesterase [Acidimicrobiales bacterium]|nr:glycerophosphodiester phosphodiesterase [Acidimicrobiales bacterium]